MDVTDINDSSVSICGRLNCGRAEFQGRVFNIGSDASASQAEFGLRVFIYKLSLLAARELTNVRGVRDAARAPKIANACVETERDIVKTGSAYVFICHRWQTSKLIK